MLKRCLRLNKSSCKTGCKTNFFFLGHLHARTIFRYHLDTEGKKIEFLGNFLCLKIHQRKSRKQMFKNNKKNSAINIFKTNNLKLPLASIQGYLQLLWPTGRRLSHLRFVTTRRGKMDHLHALTQFFLLYRHAPEIKLLQVFCWRYLTQYPETMTACTTECLCMEF